jgi:regulation of enolase protein 1 (concanavalin A-like superfamily)
MIRSIFSLWMTISLSFLVGGLLAAPPAPQWIKGWGTVADPEKDCGFESMDDRLTIRVPGTPHNLVADSGQLNAPTVLSPDRGEFIATVKVNGSVQPGPDTAIADDLPYNGAGLLLWVDQDNYIRLERAGMVRQGEFITYVNFEHFGAGRRTYSKGRRVQNMPTLLRLERRGGTIYAYASQDGVNWFSFPPLVVTLPDELKLGVAAVNTSTKPFTAELENLSVFKRESR